MKIALVHDYLNEAGGAERVLKVLSEIYPEAPIYTAFAKKGSAIIPFRDRDIRESKWAPILKIGRMYSYLRFLLPFIWCSIDLTEYDLVVTSCSGYIARGFKVNSQTKVVAYCHTPPRWLYGYETPTGASRSWWGIMFMWVFGPFIRYFDYISAQRVNTWIANSKEVKKRIAKFYRKEATVVYPPIELKYSSTPVLQYSGNKKPENRKTGKQDYFLLVSRIVGGKGIEEAVAGAQKAGVNLKIVGEKVGDIKLNEDDKIKYLGMVSDEELATLYKNARGFIALARDEDFGMTVVEAMSYGTPVLAYYGGGFKETVVEGENGQFVRETDPQSVCEGIVKMGKTNWDYYKIAQGVEKFGKDEFIKKIKEVISK